MITTEAVLPLLDDGLSKDDRRALLLELIQQQAAAPPDGAIPERLRHRLAAAGAELHELRHRNDVLADALGACRNCWGEHEECPVCDGRGRPGWRRPDPTGFRVVVDPAIRRLRAVPRAEPDVPETERSA